VKSEHGENLAAAIRIVAEDRTLAIDAGGKVPSQAATASW
jgi:hypothetical protein